MRICISTEIEEVEIKEDEKAQCGVIKTAKGNIYLMPESLYLRHKLNALRAMQNMDVTYEGQS